jgi:hypothetical protein
MRTHEQKKVLKKCDDDEAKQVEHFILDVLSKHDLASVNPVASIVGLTNALLTVATRLDVEKESFFYLLQSGWDHYQETALDEENNGRVH